MPKTSKSEKTRERFSSIISGRESSTSSRQPSARPSTTPFMIDDKHPLLSQIDKKLDKIFQQNSKISKNIDKLLSRQQSFEEQLAKLEEEFENKNETKSNPDNEVFVNVITKFFQHIIV